MDFVEKSRGFTILLKRIELILGGSKTASDQAPTAEDEPYRKYGRLEIDNNRADRALRQVAPGRVNWTFAGSPAGAERATVLYSLVASCKELGINPAAYLKDVIERIPTHPARLIAELTPRGWLKKPREERPPGPPDEPAAPS